MRADSRHAALVSEAEKLSTELAARWAVIFTPKSWDERLELLNQVHEQLQEDLGNLEMYSTVSPMFIRKLIELLSNGPVVSVAQAHIYANSQDEGHRRAAGEWLAAQGKAPSHPR
jgi:hypothetical protein